MKFDLPEPKQWFSQGDEDRFFAVIYNLNGFVSVSASESGLCIEVTAPLAREDMVELIAVLVRYDQSVNCLTCLVSHDDVLAKWFNNPQAYWELTSVSSGSFEAIRLVQ